MFRWAFSKHKREEPTACESRANYLVGFTSRPKNRRDPERVSRMKNMKGRSARKIGGGGSGSWMLKVRTVATVAAAASVPSSLTSPQALWNTPEM